MRDSTDSPSRGGNDTNSTHAQEPAASHDRCLLDWPAARDSMLKNTQGASLTVKLACNDDKHNSGEAILRGSTALQSERTLVQKHNAARILCHKSCRRGRHAPNAAWLVHARNGRLGGPVHKLLTGRSAGPPRKNCTLKPRTRRLLARPANRHAIGGRHERPTTNSKRLLGFPSCSGRPYMSRQRPTSRNDYTQLGVNTRLLFVLCKHDCQ